MIINKAFQCKPHHWINSKTSYLFCLLLIMTGQVQKGYSQSKGWDQLSDIKIDKKFNEFLGFEMDIPIFSPSVKKLDGTIITLEGFIIPTAGYKSHSEFIFSALPYNLCYFCGGAGPETVMEVEASKPIEYTAEKITLQGKLNLNADDPNRLMFILTQAKQP